MSLEPGTRLGPYEVLSPLGAGGMGEVYRVRDTRLGRDVALKVLPEAFTADPDRLARFEREAKVLASLNHPHIAQIYGLEEADGQKALVLELVEGPTLADRIAEGPIPLDEALPIAKQIAEALEAAHEQGIVHRDLKPANVKLKPDGTVKVLDFGLAKAFEPEASDPDASHSPTLTARATQMGVILGTAAYMSPEQARGKPVDKRADIWAFGVVLYEMLTGRRPFVGEDVSLTLAEVMKSEPDWSRLPGETPPSIRRLLRRCLEKELKRRLPDIAVARMEIDEAPDVDSRRTESARPRWMQLAPWGVTVLALGAAIAAWRGREAYVVTPPTRAVVALPDDQQLELREESAVNPVALSRDGRLLVYTAAPRTGGTPRLFLRSLDEFEARPIDGTEGAQAPFFSPDGRWVGFFTDETLERVSVAGGLPLKICDTAVLFPSASWGDRDRIVFSHADFGLYEVNASGGQPERLTTPDRAKGEIRHFRPQVLPGGQAVLFTVASSQGFQMALLSLDSNEWREVLDDAESARFVGAGYVVFARSGALLAVSFDPDRRVTKGSPVPLLERVSHLDGLGAAHFAVSETGTLAYPSASSGVAQARLVWVDRQGRATPILSDTASYGYPRISPDGRRVAVTVTPDIWVYDLERGTGRRITTDGYNLVPVWNPRSDRITFSAVRAQPAAFFDLHSAPADRSSPPELLLAAEGRQFPTSWVRDGRALLFFDVTAAGVNIGVLEDGKASPLLAGTNTARAAMPSPDGRWLAYVSDESGGHEVYVTRYPGLAGSERVSNHGGRDPVWSRDGKELFYFQGDQLMVVAIANAEPVLKTGPPRVLFEWRYSQSRRGYDVAPDGQRFVMIQLPEATSSHIHLVLNWLQQVERATPADR